MQLLYDVANVKLGGRAEEIALDSWRYEQMADESFAATLGVSVLE